MLPFRERLRMAWELTWPAALIDFAVVVLIHGAFAAEGETADSLWALASFFTVAPWVVRRALRIQYGIWTIQPRLTYQQSLKAMWLLMWRTLVLSLAALLVVSFILRAAGIGTHAIEEQGPLANNLGLSLADALSSLIFSPFLIPGMLRKRYRGFHLELVERKH
ncbi:MAG: hypothetical protein LAO79_10235 [Acidobacteriia bacterium]|nr:hypothetical protein [Terriglobia bacterium]